jgi:hypothetical protein
MGLGNKLIIASGITLLNKVVTKDREAERRRQSPLSFDPRLTQRDFHNIVRDLATRTPRVKGATINGLDVCLEVVSASHLGFWTADIDFNDYADSPAATGWSQPSPTPRSRNSSPAQSVRRSPGA